MKARYWTMGGSRGWYFIFSGAAHSEPSTIPSPSTRSQQMAVVASETFSGQGYPMPSDQWISSNTPDFPER